ncbi:MAG: hypothetical protein AAGG56_11865 [Pseudomonadota bacterium]
MGEPIYVFLAQAIAADGSEYRPGARHAMIVYVSAHSTELARSRVIEKINSAGWMETMILSGGAVSNAAMEGRHPVLQEAFDGAVESGVAIIIYREELRHNA